MAGAAWSGERKGEALKGAGQAFERAELPETPSGVIPHDAPAGCVTTKDENGRELEQAGRSRGREQTVASLVRNSPSVNLVQDAGVGTTRCRLRRRGGEHEKECLKLLNASIARRRR